MTSSFRPETPRVPAGGRRVLIGVTGHRYLEPADARLRAAVISECRSLRRAFPEARFRLLSGLAEGADRLAAHAAGSGLGAELIAVLPMIPAAYMRDFPSSRSRMAFLALLGRAREIIAAPLLDATSLRQGCSVRDEQYAWAGGYIAAHADVLLALWDGASARGRGGTAEIVEWFRSGRIPRRYRRTLRRTEGGLAGARLLIHINPSTLEVQRCRLPVRT